MNQQTTQPSVPTVPSAPSVLATLYLVQESPGKVVVGLPGTHYQLHLVPSGPIQPTAQGRLRGTIRCPVWKVDEVAPGGAYIEPIMGRPRRVQGRVLGPGPGENAICLEIGQTPIVADLPPRWQSRDIPAGALVGLDIKEGSSFEPA